MVAGDLAVLATHACTPESAHLGSGCGFPAPSTNTFVYPALFKIGPFSFTKPMLIAFICAGLVIWFFWAAFAKPSLVPGKLQSLGEMGVAFVRDQILRPMMGKMGDGYLPFLVSLFFFIWLMNLMEVIPVAQFPPMSLIAFPGALMLMVYVTYTYLGIKHQGLGGYFKNMIPHGVPFIVLCILAPVEILQYVIVRPFTLAIRLFANMFAGHILLLVFTLASWYLFTVGVSALYATTSFVLTIVLTAFEMLIEALQAYIFTILTAQYIGDSLGAGH